MPFIHSWYLTIRLQTKNGRHRIVPSSSQTTWECLRPSRRHYMRAGQIDWALASNRDVADDATSTYDVSEDFIGDFTLDIIKSD